MLYSTAGCRLFIADAPAEETGPMPESGWIEIGEAEALGMLGVEWELHQFEDVDCDGEHAFSVPIKSMMHRQPMQIVLGNNPEDPGQALLWQALHSIDMSWPFRLVLPDGVTERAWFALVYAASEVFDTANSLIKLQVDLKPTSDIQRRQVAP